MAHQPRFHSIQLRNFLSFGPDSPRLQLGPLNVLIGPNGSGKSNLIEALTLLQAAPKDLHLPIIKGGGVSEWLYKGSPPDPVAEIDAVLNYASDHPRLRHRLQFTGQERQFQLVDEAIENEEPVSPEYDQPLFFYRFQRGRPVLRVRLVEQAAVGEGRAGWSEG